MEDRETARMHKYGESKTTRIMMATVPHVTSSLGLRKFQADGFLLTRVYWVYILCTLRLVPHPNLTVTKIWIHGMYYTQSSRRNLLYFIRTFLRLSYNDITKYTNIQRWTGTEITVEDLYLYLFNMKCYPCTAALHRSILKLTTKQCHTEVSVLHEALGTLMMIFMKQVQIFLLIQRLYVTQTIIRCYTRVLTLQKSQIPPHFNMYLVINKVRR